MYPFWIAEVNFDRQHCPAPSADPRDMSADSEKAQPERHPDEVERLASIVSIESTETETARDVEKGLPVHAAVPSVSTSGEPPGAEAEPGVAAGAEALAGFGVASAGCEAGALPLFSGVVMRVRLVRKTIPAL